MSNIVDANYRFIAANQEVNARIAQRQQALTLYVTLTVSLLAALVALKPRESNGKLPIEWLVLGFPVASTCLAFLSYKAECAITNLRKFLSALEQQRMAENPAMVWFSIIIAFVSLIAILLIPRWSYKPYSG